MLHVSSVVRLHWLTHSGLGHWREVVDNNASDGLIAGPQCSRFINAQTDINANSGSTFSLRFGLCRPRKCILHQYRVAMTRLEARADG